MFAVLENPEDRGLHRCRAGFGSTELSRKLAQLVKMEKNVMRSMELVGRERMEVAVGRRCPNACLCRFTDLLTATIVDLGRGMRR
jgi:hypothetical protein